VRLADESLRLVQNPDNKHTGNWSAGCQVISGGGYINHDDEIIDC
jgi:hypothetical protein